ncbi:MAG: hypothetical protein KC535_05195 [Nanoarchaeota archaeon]|nr:hypothetical protein [Nanoarchaeota archaeon]
MGDDYFSRMDQYLAPREENRFLSGKTTGEEGAPRLSDPIVPISKLGTTFAEKGPSGQSTVLQSMLASIRQGTGQLQLAIQTPTNAQLGGGISSIGKDQRQAIKELIKASEIEWQGLEMPVSSMSNMSGFDPQRGGFSEEKRKQDLRSVKDAILFSAEIGAGGGVDVWSQEYMRNIHDAGFKDKFQDFEGFDENYHSIKTLVDDRTGQVMQFQTASLGGPNTPKISVPIWKTARDSGVGPNGVPYSGGDYLDADGNKLVADSNDKEFVMNRVPEWNDKEKRFESKTMNWTEFKRYAEERNRQEGKDLAPEVWYQRVQLENQYAQQRGQSLYYSQQYSEQLKQLQKLQESLTTYQKLEEGKNEQELLQMNLLQPVGGGGGLVSPDYKKRSEIIKETISDLKQRLHHVHEASALADAQANSIWGNITHVKSVDEYAKNKTFDSYADLGIFALEQTKRNPGLAKPIHVGPELGWPQAYGGHTDEFIEIIKSSRNKMIEKMRQDPKYRSMYTDKQMKDLAKKHISGMLDTSHLSMWYNHFPQEDAHESEESRLKRFNKWYLKQIDKLGEADVVGSVQIVDSATGDHRHLPVGQGIFPTVDAVKRLQKHGFDGPILSEGHEEENLEPGRIQYSLWEAFGASIGSGGYHFGGAGAPGNSFGNIYGGIGGAAGYRAPPNYIVGAYAPSNEWKLWSEVPLE